MLNGMGDDDGGGGGRGGAISTPHSPRGSYDLPIDYLDIAVGQRRIMEMEGTHSITQ